MHTNQLHTEKAIGGYPFLLPTDILEIGDNFIITDIGEISKSDFWNFINRNDLNEWCNDYAFNGSHRQEVGRYSIDQYFDLTDDYFILKNIREYLKQLRYGSPKRLRRTA